tara:strand:- start:472 stop:723 length:252 start_codon:yes stop_codon:yes gene_type:complete
MVITKKEFNDFKELVSEHANNLQIEIDILENKQQEVEAVEHFLDRMAQLNLNLWEGLKSLDNLKELVRKILAGEEDAEDEDTD